MTEQHPEHVAPDGGRLITLAEAAATLSVSVRTVRRLIQHGYLEGYRVGPRAIRVHEGAVKRQLRRMPEGYPGGD
jgi:excisionase family DNA binding protein